MVFSAARRCRLKINHSAHFYCNKGTQHPVLHLAQCNVQRYNLSSATESSCFVWLILVSSFFDIIKNITSPIVLCCLFSYKDKMMIQFHCIDMTLVVSAAGAKRQMQNTGYVFSHSLTKTTGA